MTENKKLQRLTAKYNAVVEQNRSLQKDNKFLRKTLINIADIANECDIPPCNDFMETWRCKEKHCKDETSDNGKYCMYFGFFRILEKIENVGIE